MICQHEKLEIILETKGYKFCTCLLCSLVFARQDKQRNPVSAEVYQNYYKPEAAARFGFIVELIVKTFRFLRARQIAFLNPGAKSILDIGSGRGWMLYFLKKYFNYETAAGTQIAENAYKFSKEKLKLEIYNQDLLEVPFEKKFSVITAWHVLEHVDKPEQYIARIYELLDSRGRLFIEVPNYDSWSRKLTQEHWLALDLKHHLVFFTFSSLVSLLEKYNFKVKKTESFSWEYSAFTSTQSLVNLLTNSDSYFFAWLQNKDHNPKIIWHAFLFLILFLPCLLVNFLLYFSNRGEVISIIAQKND